MQFQVEQTIFVPRLKFETLGSNSLNLVNKFGFVPRVSLEKMLSITFCACEKPLIAYKFKSNVYIANFVEVNPDGARERWKNYDGWDVRLEVPFHKFLISVYHIISSGR